jgi:hypothetical protein
VCGRCGSWCHDAIGQIDRILRCFSYCICNDHSPGATGRVHGRRTLLHRSRRKFTLLRRLCRRRGLLHNGSACRSAERAVLPNDARRAASGELQTGMSTAVALLKINCPTYRAPRPVVRLEVMEQYLTTLLRAVGTASRVCEVERRAERALQQTYPRSGLTPRHANASWC